MNTTRVKITLNHIKCFLFSYLSICISVGIEHILLDDSVVRSICSEIETVREVLIEGTVNPYVLGEEVETVKTK